MPTWMPRLVIVLLGSLLACGPADLETDQKTQVPAAAPPPASSHEAEPRPALDLGPGPHLGIDVSHHSGTIDWPTVAQEGFVFAYVKASEGVDAPDPRFEENWQALADLDMYRGAYHFYVTEDDPEEQAKLFLSTYTPQHGDLPPVVDVEVIGRGTAEGWQSDLLRFLEILAEEAGVRPILYTSPNFWDANIHESFRQYPLWVAEYEVDEPEIPEGWEGWVMWQFEGEAAIPGVEKDVDKSKTHADVDLHALRIPARLR